MLSWSVCEELIFKATDFKNIKCIVRTIYLIVKVIEKTSIKKSNQ